METRTIEFTDLDSGARGFILVRAVTDDAVGLTISLEEDGDVGVFLRREDAAKLAEGLKVIGA
jgi:hypothetical protein